MIGQLWRRIAPGQLSRIERKLDHLLTVQKDVEKSVKLLERSQAFYLGDHTALTRLINGRAIFVDTRDRGLGTRLLRGGLWEANVTPVFEKLVKPGSVVVDVGANLGYYSILAAHIAGPKGMVHAFEPNPRLYRLLNESFRFNGYLKTRQVRAYRRALWHERRAFTMRYLPGKLMQGSIFKHDEKDGAYAEARVIAVRLDDFLPDLVADVIKIDVEGADAQALYGMENTIARSPNVQIIYEYTPRELTDFVPLDEFCQFLDRCGLKTFLINQRSKVVPIDRRGLEKVPKIATLLFARQRPAI
ncbi:MAG: FkbM family methyltransferase [Pseudomonadota bacterium]